MTKTRKNKSVFNKTHYNSGDGMLTTIWGPSMWHSLHTISFNYPVQPTIQHKKHYRDFILQLKYVLPCGKCRSNLYKNFERLPLKVCHMKSRETFSRYVYDLHELINDMLGKKSNLSYEDVKDRYEHFRARCKINNYKEFLGKVENIKRKTAKNKTGKTKNTKSELGCTEPIYGEKAKCVIHIVPQNEKCNTFNIDKRCISKKTV